MSGWDSYVDSIAANSGNAAEKVCLIGLDGGAKWTTDGHAKALKVTPQEGCTIAKCFKDKEFTPLQANGVVVEGVKYQFLRSEDDKIVYAKKKECGTLSMQSTKQAVIIAKCAEGQQPGNVNKAVASMAEYLESSGY